jgi:hypothetical protein
MGNEMESAIEFAVRVWPLWALKLAQEIEYRDAAIRRECAERAIAYIKTLTSEDLDLWGDREDEGLRRAIIESTWGEEVDHDTN